MAVSTIFAAYPRAVRDLARDAGKQIPQQISVVGFDDIQAATIVQPTLTTIRQPLIRMGMMAATEILASIEDPILEPRRISIKPELVERQSCAACPES